MEVFKEFDSGVTNPEKNFSGVINHAFNVYGKAIGWGILMMILYIIIGILLSSFTDLVFGFDQNAAKEIVQDALRSKDYDKLMTVFEVDGYKESQLVSNVLQLLLYPFYVGFLYILQKCNRGTKVEFTDLFIGYRQNTLQILLYGLLSGIILLISLMLCVLPFFFIAPMLLIGLSVVFFENKTAVQGISKSFQIASQNYWTFLGIAFISGLLAFSGILLCFIGIIATMPFWFAASYSTYCAYCGTPKQI